MVKVGILDCHTTEFTKETDKDIVNLACESAIPILRNNPLENDIESVIISSCSEQQYLGPIVSESLGIKPKNAFKLDNLCNSGTNSITIAYSLISSGICESALVIGVEKTPSPGSVLKWDITRGSFRNPIYWASLFAKSHMKRYKTTREQIAMVAVNNRKNASSNPKALFRDLIKIEDVLKSRLISYPLRLFDCSYSCNGASAILLASENLVKKTADQPLWIKGIGQSTQSASFSKIASNLASLESTKNASRQAFHMSKLKPKDIDIIELHDAFTILQILALEDMGFVEKGKGGYFIERNQDTGFINPRGGILGCGHAIGATGIAQTVEVIEQLKGLAGERQISNCNNGIVHNLSAAGTSANILIIGKD